MTVADVRKSLAVLRKEWESHAKMSPICLSMKVSDSMCASEFAFLFIMGHHEKRHQKKS